MDEDQPTVEVVDALGHTLPAMTCDLAERMVQWLDLEAAAGESSPGLDELRRQIRAQLEADDAQEN